MARQPPRHHQRSTLGPGAGLADPIALGTELGLDLASPVTVGKLVESAGAMRQTLQSKRILPIQALLARIVRKVDVYADSVKLSLAGDALLDALGLSAIKASTDDLHIDLAVHLKRSGKVVRLLLETGKPALGSAPDIRLLAAIGLGRQFWQGLQANPEVTVTEFARSQSLSKSYVDRVLRLAFLSPGIVQAVLDSTAPADLTLDRLKDVRLIAPAWHDQHRRLGIASDNV
jgi:hypothetical protein